VVKVLTITGYKPQEIGIYKQDEEGIIYIKKAIEQRLISLIEQGVEWILISGQLGVELWAAEVILSLKEEYDQIKLAVITPFLEQEEKWNEANQQLYMEIISQADYTNSVTNRKYDHPSQFRMKTQFLIEKSDALLVLFDEEVGGSPKYMINEAEKKSEQSHYSIYYITPFDIQNVVEEVRMQDPNYWAQ
jgi:uncharacterized phage-like protein YoqJ